MSVYDCPKCHKKELRIVNVMSTTQRIHVACSNCCFKAKVPYDDDGTNHWEKIEVMKHGFL